MPELDSEAIDFRAASELFAPMRTLKRAELETLRLVMKHQGRKVGSALRKLNAYPGERPSSSAASKSLRSSLAIRLIIRLHSRARRTTLGACLAMVTVSSMTCQF